MPVKRKVVKKIKKPFFRNKPDQKSKLILPYFCKGIIIVLAIILVFDFIITHSSINFRKYWYRPNLIAGHLNKYDVVMIKGEEFHLFLYGFHNKWVSYSSSNFRVAGVNMFGKVRAYQPGKAFIKVKSGEKEYKCRVRVVDINNEKLSLRVGERYRLKTRGIASIPKWRSSNPKVARVSMFGTVKAKAKGKATITVTVKGRTLKCLVVVK